MSFTVFSYNALSPANVNKLVCLNSLTGWPVMTVTSKPAFEIAFDY